MNVALQAVWRRAWRFDDEPLLSAQMGLIDRNVPAALLASPVLAWLTALAFQLVLGWAEVVWWAMAITVLSATAWLVLQSVPRQDGQILNVRRYALFMRIFASCLGFGWGSLALMFADPHHPISLALVMGMGAGVHSAGLAVVGVCWPLAMTFGLAGSIPALVGFAQMGGAAHLTLTLAVVIYIGVMTVLSYHTARVTQRSIELRFENGDLVRQLQDHTQQAQDARQMAEAAVMEAEAANRAKTVFLGAVSHDLRQPLHAAGLFLGALERLPLEPHARDLLDKAMAAHQGAIDMLATLMDFSKADAGVVQSQPQAFALQALLHKLGNELAPDAEDKGLALRWRDTPLCVYADPALLEMVLRNLLSNAIRYTERGAVLLACRRRGETVVIEVWDTGIGIAPAHQQLVFGEFQQLHNPERDRRKGLGLGLAIVERLARAMHAPVSLRSRPGHGSVFRITVPRVAGPVSAAGPQVPESRGIAGLKILVVEDDDGVREAMAVLLASWGCEARVVACGAAARACLPTFPPDVVVLDHRLKNHETGWQVVLALWSDLGYHVPAILVTGDTAAERLHEAREAGVLVVHKPVQAERLLAALTEVDPRQQRAAA